jgi:hypothetical protein
MSVITPAVLNIEDDGVIPGTSKTSSCFTDSSTTGSQLDPLTPCFPDGLGYFAINFSQNLGKVPAQAKKGQL